MEEWKEYKLKDICIKITDGSHSSPKGVDDGYPMFSVKDMQEYGFDYSKCKHVSYDDFLSLKQNDCVPQKGDVLVAKDGSYLKQIFVCKETRDEGILSSIAIFRPNTLVDPFFLCYLLKSPEVYNYIANNCVSGSALPRIVLKDFKEVKLRVPSLTKQKEIVSILKSLDDKIEVNRRINENLEQQAQALFKSWFMDYEPFKDGEFVESELGRIPKGWRVVTLAEMTSKFGTGLNPRNNFKLGEGKNFYVTIKNMGNNRVYLDERCDKVTDEAIAKINKRSKLQVGDLLFSGIGTIGRVALITEPPTNWNTSESVFNMHPAQNISSEFLYVLLQSDVFQNYVKINALGGVQQGIRMASLKDYKMVLPDDFVLRNFDKVITPLISKIKSNERQSDRLASLRDTLLPRLMSGELKVNEIETKIL